MIKKFNINELEVIDITTVLPTLSLNIIKDMLRVNKELLSEHPNNALIKQNIQHIETELAKRLD